MIISWLTTNKCNLNCKHCYQDAGQSFANELTTTEAKAMIEEIKIAGFKVMIFSGGEPLLREDIFELVEYAAALGLRPVFGTNGTLITRQTAQRLKDCGTGAMGISLDSLDETRHNHFRGADDAFKRTLEGIGNCTAAGLPYQIHTTIMAWNENEVFDITDFAVQNGAIAHYIFFLIPAGRGVEIEHTSLPVTTYEKQLAGIMEKQKTTPIPIKPTCAPQFTRVAKQMEIATPFSKGCLAGLSYCVITPRGLVRPCAYMAEIAGDIRAEPFHAIWENSPVFHRLRSLEYKGACQICRYKDICGGCRARASYYHEGDYLAEDSYCQYAKELQV